MAFPAIPVVLGITGLAALVLPKIRAQPRALTTEEYKKELPPQPPGFDPLPNYQPIPQTDPSRPSIIRTERGQDAAMRIHSAKPYDGVEPPGDYLGREVNRMQLWIRDALMIAVDSLQSAVIVPGSQPGPVDILGPQVEVRPGMPAALDVYWLTTSRDLHIPPPSESGVFIEKFVYDPKGRSTF